MEPESYNNKYARYGSRVMSIGVLLLICSFIYFIVLEKKSADLQKKTAESKILALKKVHTLDSLQHIKDSINLALTKALSNTLNQDNVSKSPEDARLTNKVDINAAKAINRADGTFWVYLGQIVDKKWKPKNFIFELIPAPGDFILAGTAVYKRNAMPVKLTDNSWKLGIITGVINGGTLIKIDKVQKIDDENYWAQAEFNNWVVVMGGSGAIGTVQQHRDKLQKSGVASLIIFRDNTYRNISLPFKSQEEATAFVSKNKASLPTDAYVVKLSTWAPKLSFNGAYYLDNSKSNKTDVDTEFIRTNIEFTFNGAYVPNISGTIATTDGKNVSFDVVNNAERKINWTAYLPYDKYTITLADDHFKLPNNKRTFSFTKSQVTNGVALITIAVDSK